MIFTSPVRELADGYQVQRCTLLDVRALRKLHRVVFPRDAYPYFDLIFLMLWPGVVNLKISAPDGTLAAFVSTMQSWSAPHGWIVMIGTAPAHQRRGLATTLLALAEQRIAPPAMRLTVRDGNHPAIRLYQREGYRVIDKKIGYYRDGETGLVMEKRRASS